MSSVDGRPAEVLEEHAALTRILAAIRNYRFDAEWEVARWEHNYRRLSRQHQALLQSVPARVAEARRGIQINTFFFSCLLYSLEDEIKGLYDEMAVVAASKQMQCTQQQAKHRQQPPPPPGPPPPHAAAMPLPGGLPEQLQDVQQTQRHPNQQPYQTQQGEGKSTTAAAASSSQGLSSLEQPGVTQQMDVEKVRYVLKNLARDWSAEGAAERQQSYGRILQELQRLFGSRASDESPPRVLVPGCGLGRLCVEVTRLGLECQGNEHSYFMLLAASFVLNHLERCEQLTIHPWLHSSSNHLRDEDQLRALAVPDELPADMVAQPGLLSMVAGDFVEVYGAPALAGSFDCVATCFFIDTAHNVVEYLEVIARLLRPGGAWVNLGPLLYHWADSASYMDTDQLSIELPLEEVLRVAQSLGLRMVRNATVTAPYMANSRSMYQTTYQAAFFTMIKEGGGQEQQQGQQEQPEEA